MQHLHIHARVDQSSQKHVAADASEAVEINNAHEAWSFPCLIFIVLELYRADLSGEVGRLTGRGLYG